MSKKANPTYIGIFVVGAISLIIASVLIFGSGRLFKTTYRHVIFFDGSVKGLRVGAPVNFRGVQVGEVVAIRLMINNSSLEIKIPVIIEIDPENFENVSQNKISDTIKAHNDAADRLVEKGLRAQLEMQSLVTGLLQINLDFHPYSPAELVNLPEIEYHQIPSIKGGLEQLASEIKEIPFHKMAQNAVDALEGIEELVNSTEVHESIMAMRNSAQNLDRTMEHFRRRLPEIIDTYALTMDQARVLMASVDKHIDPIGYKLEGTLARAEDVMENLDESTREGRQLHVELNRAIKEIRLAARSVRLLSDQLQAQPESLLRGKKAGGSQ